MMRKTWLTAGAALAVAVAATMAQDKGKKALELPTEGVLAKSAPSDVNPKVEPGKVKWHASLAAAEVAATRSGKPVLAFYMMGRLDDRFC